MTLLTAGEWDQFITRYPEAHLLQTAAWGELKSAFGWQAQRIAVGDCGAQVLFRRLGAGLSLAYIPKGPLGESWASLWPEVDALCRSRRAVFLKVEPDYWSPLPPDFTDRQLPDFRPSPQEIQPPRTVVVDLCGEEEEILARMKQKTRYNIRLAEKKGVSVRAWDDLEGFHGLMTVTGQRDGFGVHAPGYYRCAYDRFAPQGDCRLLVAEFAGQPLAALMVFARGRRAWYFYGASNDQERNRMPTYLLQWEAMRWARGRGCQEYDLWGVPDAQEEALEASFEGRSDGLWGVYRFKRGFGGRVLRAAGAWDRVYQPALYAAYRWWAGRRKAGLPA